MSHVDIPTWTVVGTVCEICKVEGQRLGMCAWCRRFMCMNCTHSKLDACKTCGGEKP